MCLHMSWPDCPSKHGCISKVSDIDVFYTEEYKYKCVCFYKLFEKEYIHIHLYLCIYIYTHIYVPWCAGKKIQNKQI